MKSRIKFEQLTIKEDLDGDPDINTLITERFKSVTTNRRKILGFDENIMRRNERLQSLNLMENVFEGHEALNAEKFIISKPKLNNFKKQISPELKKRLSKQENESRRRSTRRIKLSHIPFKDLTYPNEEGNSFESNKRVKSFKSLIGIDSINREDDEEILILNNTIFEKNLPIDANSLTKLKSQSKLKLHDKINKSKDFTTELKLLEAINNSSSFDHLLNMTIEECSRRNINQTISRSDQNNSNKTQGNKLSSKKQIYLTQLASLTNNRLNSPNRKVSFDIGTKMIIKPSENIAIANLAHEHPSRNPSNKLLDDFNKQTTNEKNFAHQLFQIESSIMHRSGTKEMSEFEKKVDEEIKKTIDKPFKRIDNKSLWKTKQKAGSTIDSIASNSLLSKIEYNEAFNTIIKNSIEHDKRTFQNHSNEIRKRLKKLYQRGVIEVPKYNEKRDFLNYRLLKETSSTSIIQKMNPTSILRHGQYLVDKFNYQFDSSFLNEFNKNNLNSTIKLKPHRNVYSDVLKNVIEEQKRRVLQPHKANTMYINDESPTDIVKATLAAIEDKKIKNFRRIEGILFNRSKRKEGGQSK